MISKLSVILIIILIVTTLLINKMFYNKRVVMEHYLDLIPTYLIDNISRCYTKECVLNESYNCYKYCDKVNRTKCKEKL